jgi:hypothetical protein
LRPFGNFLFLAPQDFFQYIRGIVHDLLTEQRKDFY